jgi:hypothetical protein
MGGKAEHGETKHPISWPNMIHTGSDGPNYAGNLVAEDVGVWRFARIQRERLEHVAEIHPCRFDLDEYFAGSAGRQNERRKTQCIQVAAFARFEP